MMRLGKPEIFADMIRVTTGKEQAKKKEGNCYNCGKANHWAKECRAPKKQTAATAGKATKTPKEKKAGAAGPRGPLEEPPTEKDY
ncbi:hypothetical protein EG329_011056 [Mollisiaceae sp. DMI_Dod_QoI]|nr:hypothetical protein EG329_011056 [Helotiales sp. DMI_Dod_QoI]